MSTWRPVGKIVRFIIKRTYLLVFPLDENLKTEIEKFYSENEARKKKRQQINELRLNNVFVALSANSNAILAFTISFISFVLSACYSVIKITVKGDSYSKYWPILFVTSIVSIYLLIRVLRKSIDYLPSEKYAQLSLSDLDPSQVLSFVALKYWQISNEFTLISQNQKLNKFFDKIENAKDYLAISELFKSEYQVKLEQAKDIFALEIEKYIESITTFKSKRYKLLSNCKALKNESVSILKILPTELSHHVFKFSPHIFELRVNSFLDILESLKTLTSAPRRKMFEEDLILPFQNKIIEARRIITDIIEKRHNYLLQIVFFSHVHPYIIGLASTTSTSKSLKIFTRGLSNLLSSSENNLTNNYFDFRSLLHRGKAHYGFDLLILIENFYSTYFKTNEKKFKIPELLKNIIQDKSMPIDPSDTEVLNDMMLDIIIKYNEINNSLCTQFNIQLQRIFNELDSCQNNMTYFVIFGYSNMVKKVISSCSNFMNDNNIKVFVLKEEDELMLETRMMRFELNDLSSQSYRNTFTGSDLFLERIIGKNDKVVFVGGAESIDRFNRTVYHTNNYQKRVEGLLTFFSSKFIGYNKPEIWIISEQYKIFDNLLVPKDNRFFLGELFVDHYDKMDIYKFTDFGYSFDIIHEGGIEKLS